jgi:hypothetical protein
LIPYSDPTSAETLRTLRREYPDTPFLALGQTVFWDEPMKAVLRRMLDDLDLGGEMVLGVHDTDYFARLKARREGSPRFEMLPHNGGSTRDFWSAAGEISRLFGSETWLTRDDMVRHGVPVSALMSRQEDPAAWFDAVTEAWGWRGLVYTGSRDMVVNRLRLEEMEGALRELLQFGMEGTRESIADNCCREEAESLGAVIRDWKAEWRRANPHGTLSALYQHLLPRMMGLLLGALPKGVRTTCTTDLLHFNPQTAVLPRFALVDAFLNPATRSVAERAYNAAVQGGEMYTLDRFGLGATPFDVILPEHGRGTLRVTLRAVHIETREPLRIPLQKPLETAAELAAVLTDRFGDRVTLVGKAVSLIAMLAAEFMFVFNEGGSSYVWRTRQMNDLLAQSGIDLGLKPIVRLRYHTWDSLRETPTTFVLPPHMQSAFGRRTVPAAEFAAEWRSVTAQQERLLLQLRETPGTADFLKFLHSREGGWTEEAARLQQARDTLRALRAEALEVHGKVRDAYAELAEIKRSIVAAEKEKGDHFRSVTDWTNAETSRRAAYSRAIAELLGQRRALLHRIADLKSRRMAIERSSAAVSARRAIAEVEISAGLQRLRLMREAALTSRALLHADHRPAAWWLPMADRTGRWFSHVCRTTEVYPEPLRTDQPSA